jgi:hypothetical protein
MEHLALASLDVVVGLSLGILIFVSFWAYCKEETARQEPVPAQEAKTFRR